MASVLKVDKLDPQSGTALEIGTSGDTITIPSGATIVNSGTATGFGAITALNNATATELVTVGTTTTELDAQAGLTWEGSSLSIQPASNATQLKLLQNNGTDNWGFHCDSGGGPLTFDRYTGGATIERMRIESLGTVCIGTTGAIDASSGTAEGFSMNVDNLVLSRDGGSALILRRTTSDGRCAQFFRQNTEVGYIEVSAASTFYSTSSDYRIKENVTDLTDAVDRVKNLKPKRFNFIVDETNTIRDGFIAHEVSGIVPEAISGTKDQVEKNEDGTNKLDEDGNTIPIMQGIDQAKLVPLLTSALQEAITKIETLETKVTALENA
jgi:transcriptional regulator of NAD metabolism